MTSDSLSEDVQRFLDTVARENGFKEPTYDVAPATKTGDNMVGLVSRVVIREKSSPGKELSVIVKTAPANKVRRMAFQTPRIFRNEANMYQIVLPALNSLLRKYGLSNSEIYPGTARCYGAKFTGDLDAEELDVIVLEDMGKLGYKLADRLGSAGLDAASCESVLKELARLHGASLALRHLDPKEAQRIESSIEETVYNRTNPNIEQLQPIVENSAKLTLSRYPPGTPEHAKLRKFLDNYIEDVIFLNKPNDTLSCINHGDCWSNNALFKTSKTGAPENLCLLDFQLSKVSSPVIDIMYLIFSCTTKETRDAHYHRLMKTYHQELSSILEKCGLNPGKVIPWTTFQEQLKMYGRYGLASTLLTITFTLAKSSQENTLDDMCEQKAPVSELFTSQLTAEEGAKERLSDVLLDSIQLGYLYKEVNV